MPIKLVVGLGNPGKSYASTRHNVGRRVLELLSQDPPPNTVLFEPETFMNTSGGPVAEISRKKGILPSQIVVILDDFEIPLGTLRIRMKGSSGGHNGLKSILETLGTQDVPRVRVGIGPVPDEQDPADFVLKTFTSGERAAVEKTVEQAAEAIRVAVTEGLETAMNRFNTKAESKKK